MNNWEPVIRYCRNCGAKITGYRDEKGVVKTTCVKCGAATVSRQISRRQERCDTYAPSGMLLPGI